MSASYFLINLAMFLPVLISSVIPGLPRLNWKQVARGVTLLALPFILWDFWATAQGHWAFSETQTLGWKIGNLPFEEVLFFFTAPLGCWYLLEAIHTYARQRILTFPSWLPLVFACATASGSIYFFELQYTFVVTFLTTCILLLWWWKNRLQPTIEIANITLWYFFTGFCLFFIFNSLLTGLEIVTYGVTHSTGLRIGTIPIEDFFYNFLLLTGILLVDASMRQLRRTNSAEK
jgi:lycopene cyclase domain-containing protein